MAMNEIDYDEIVRQEREEREAQKARAEAGEPKGIFYATPGKDKHTLRYYTRGYTVGYFLPDGRTKRQGVWFMKRIPNPDYDGESPDNSYRNPKNLGIPDDNIPDEKVFFYNTSQMCGFYVKCKKVTKREFMDEWNRRRNEAVT